VVNSVISVSYITCWLFYLYLLFCCDIWHTDDTVDHFAYICYFVVIYDTLMTRHQCVIYHNKITQISKVINSVINVSYYLCLLFCCDIWHTDDTVDYFTYICYFVVIYDTLAWKFDRCEVSVLNLKSSVNNLYIPE
jgi:hypothetical protein